jgi:cell division protein FtsZ
MNDPAPIHAEHTATPTPKSHLTVKAFGLGSAGLNMLEQLARSGVPPASLVAVHSDATALSACSAGEKVHFENKPARRGKSSDSTELTTEMAAEDQSPRLRSLCSATDVIFIIAGLGGSFGTILSSVVASAAREAGAFVLAFVALPFDCEGSQRAQFADSGLKRLKENSDLVISWPNQRTLGTIDQTTSLLDTFKASNRFLASCVHGIWRALGSETAMGLSFIELCRSISSHSIESVFGIAECAGQDRASDALEHLFAHPMLSDPDTFQRTPALAVCILGAHSLSMAEVNNIMEQLHRRSEGASVMMSAMISPELADSVVILLLLPRPDQEIESAESATDQTVPDIARRGTLEDLKVQLLDTAEGKRPHSRFVPPAPSLPPEKMAQLLKQQGRSPGRTKKRQSKLRQTQLPLEIVSKGRFDKSEPTIHKGEDLDVPTYIRRGVALN